MLLEYRLVEVDDVCKLGEIIFMAHPVVCVTCIYTLAPFLTSTYLRLSLEIPVDRVYCTYVRRLKP